MTNPDVSILVVSYNHSQFIERALKSISAQQSSFSIEVVIADDASTDGTRERAIDWANGCPFPARVLDLEDNLGITKNYARGFAACRGRFIAVLEGDDEWISIEKIQRQAETLENNPDITMVANRFLRLESDIGRARVFPPIGTDGFITTVASEELAETNWFGTFSTCMYRTSALRRISPEIFESTSYDWIVAMAITEFGDAAFLPEVTALYRVHSAGVWSGTPEYQRLLQLRELLPTYMQLLGGRLDRQLSVILARVERDINSSRVKPT